MQRQILVPLDGSALAETVLPHAAVLARATGSTLTLLRVILSPLLMHPELGIAPGVVLTAEALEIQEAEARTYLETVAARLEAVSLTVRTALVEGDPATTIVGWAAQDPPLRMVAMATHGRSGLRRWVFGSVAEKVLQAVATPLLLVRGSADTPEGKPLPSAHLYHTLVVPLDGSPLAERALHQAVPLAQTTGATLILVAVAPALDEETSGATELSWAPAAQHETTLRLTEYLTRTAAHLQAADIPVQTRLEYGHPAEGILRLGEEVGADLIVMSTHGRGGIQRFWLGSTALKVVQSTHRPVLLVRA